MSEAKLSQRAQKILTWLTSSPSPDAGEGFRVRFLRQQTLADQLGCSRRSIGRALKELKEAGLLVDLNKRHENRCKLYQVVDASLRGGVADVAIQDSMDCFSAKALRNDNLTPHGEQQLKLYRFTFESNFREWPDWEKYYPQVTWELKNETDVHALWRKTFDKLYVIRNEEGACLY